MNKGEILLYRKDNDFRAGFCVIDKSLPDLIKESWMLHPDELSYYKTLEYDKRRTSYLLGRIAAKNSVSEFLHEDIVFPSFSIKPGVFQFPVVKHITDYNVQVSISHCDNIGVALAFPEEHPMGIDIERIREDKIDVMKTVISKNESKLIDHAVLHMSVASCLVWSVKESLSKVLKTGLTLDFGILEINSLEKKGLIYQSTFTHFSQYKAISFKIDEYICSIVLPEQTRVDLESIRNAFNIYSLNNL